jgi:hypothetical protein
MIILENDSIFQYETAAFYFKITKVDGSYEYKEKSGNFHYVKIDSTGGCWSRDKTNFQTYTSGTTQANFLANR